MGIPCRPLQPCPGLHRPAAPAAAHHRGHLRPAAPRRRRWAG